jgi:hypothetical protein
MRAARRKNGKRMIAVSRISKTYQGYDIDHKESGLVLWAKNAFKLTSNRAASVQALQGARAKPP